MKTCNNCNEEHEEDQDVFPCERCKTKIICVCCVKECFMQDANGMYNKLCKVCFSGGLSWMLGEMQKSEDQDKN